MFVQENYCVIKRINIDALRWCASLRTDAMLVLAEELIHWQTNYYSWRRLIMLVQNLVTGRSIDVLVRELIYWQEN